MTTPTPAKLDRAREILTLAQRRKFEGKESECVEAARLMMRYGGSLDRRIAMRWIPYQQRRAILAAQRAQAREVRATTVLAREVADAFAPLVRDAIANTMMRRLEAADPVAVRNGTMQSAAVAQARYFGEEQRRTIADAVADAVMVLFSDSTSEEGIQNGPQV